MRLAMFKFMFVERFSVSHVVRLNTEHSVLEQGNSDTSGENSNSSSGQLKYLNWLDAVGPASGSKALGTIQTFAEKYSIKTNTRNLRAHGLILKKKL